MKGLVDWGLVADAALYSVEALVVIAATALALWGITVLAVNTSPRAFDLADDLGLVRTIDGVCWRKSRITGRHVDHEPGLTGKCSWCGHECGGGS